MDASRELDESSSEDDDPEGTNWSRDKVTAASATVRIAIADHEVAKALIPGPLYVKEFSLQFVIVLSDLILVVCCGLFKFIWEGKEKVRINKQSSARKLV
mmetsp:Transcript_3756/g.5262  ORF Transcript_3756/g.5262 Transcript_3756/m.5262 type:complete len:100 (-) Transcript_3756:239-538(-)